MNTENTQLEPATPNAIASAPLATIDPPSFVEAVYGSFHGRLEAAIKESDGVTYDITTTTGIDTAKRIRATFRDIRIQGEAERKNRKAPILQIGKLLDSKYDELEALVRPHEEKHDTVIKAEEQRKEAEKAEKIRAEAERQAQLDSKIDYIKNAPLVAINLDASKTQALIDELSVIVPTAENYEERYVEAEAALESAIASLQSLHAGKVAIEQQQAQAKALAEQQEAERKAADRVANIKAQIQSIKNNVIDGTECETSAALQLIIDKVSALSIDGFEEFAVEAQQAKESTLISLGRQLKLIAVEEAEKAAQEAEAVKVVEQPVPVLSHPAVAESVSRPADSMGEPVKPFAARQVNPGPENIIALVADTYGVENLVALAWLAEIDFSTISRTLAEIEAETIRKLAA